MEELIKRLERVIQMGVPDKDGMHPISAETVLEVVKEQLGTNLAEVGTDVPDNNVGELISRQQAIDIAKELTITIEGYEMHNQAVMNYCAEIIQLLPIQPEPKRGKWIRTGSGSLYDHYECSECGKAPKWECMGNNRWKIAFTDFCPNCGADMRGGQDG